MSTFSSTKRDKVVEDVETDEPAVSQTANVGETSVEIDVVRLIAELEAEKAKGVDNDGHLRQRLDEILESKRHVHDMDDFEEYELEED
jgi:hypothetical protein